MENYLLVLEESLAKKLAVLEQIEEQNGLEEQILLKEEVVMEEFDAAIERKAALVQELNRLDEGFETLYDRIREQLLQDKQHYKIQIGRLQKQIEEVMQRSILIQTQEARNKRLAENYFAGAKKELKQGRMNSRAALDYYRNVNKANYIPPQFMDKKK